MEIQFAKINPTQNMTIIVLDPVDRALQPQVAEKLMDYGSVFAEQVGFLEKPAQPGAMARLQMMGGEFCGNATMSLAAYLAHTGGMQDGEKCVYPLEISGADEILHCDIQKSGSFYAASVAMPLPERIERVNLPGGKSYPAVFFPGIAHLIVPMDEMDESAAENAIAGWCAVLNTDALGIILANSDYTAIKPIVYVRETCSSVWERGCGSGTAAVGAYLASKEQKNISVSVSQPGGTISADVCWGENGLSGIRIRSNVRISAIGTAWIE